MNARGRAAGLAACACIVALVATAGPTARAAGGDGETRTGITSAYLDGSYAGDFRVRAGLVLPPVPANRGWYTNWIMLAAGRDDALEQPFIQVGLMRWRGNGFRLSSFVAYGKDAPSMTYEDVALVADGPHAVGLVGRGEVIEAWVDGAVVRRIPRARLFSEGDVPYVQAAAEVFAAGDTASGRIDGLQVASGAAAAFEPAVPRCLRDDRGLRLQWDGRALSASGRFQAGAPSAFRCTDELPAAAAPEPESAPR